MAEINTHTLALQLTDLVHEIGRDAEALEYKVRDAKNLADMLSDEAGLDFEDELARISAGLGQASIRKNTELLRARVSRRFAPQGRG